ncbi:MAG: Outer membrane protein assembly factor BamA [Alphaproteobacteria bacterium MarineAlpha3_Bin5]|nr:MAG: Outer membrane protein assembly factor BamA [Alphaproteobacteria bacterium MarineAlpha3_Bin5]
MRKKYYIIFSLLLLTLFISNSRAGYITKARPSLDLAQGWTVESIEVRGSQRVEPGTVRSYLLVREGDSYDRRRVDRSLKSLYSTGLFADISIRQEGNKLIITVVENPIINRISFEGNLGIEDSDLKSEISLRPRIVYTRSKVQSDVKRILSIYRQNGRFAASVEPKVIQLEQNRVDLVFEISEGDETAIRSIKFVGNKEFSDGRLREVVSTKETTIWNPFSTSDVYDPDRLNYDRELLRRFYMTNGYTDFRIHSAVAELSPDNSEFFITFAVDEGIRYRFGKIDIEARLADLKKEDLLGIQKFETGDWYDANAVEESINSLTEQVGELGYAFVDIRPKIKREREKKLINIVFEINEGPRVFLERIDIEGNVRTLDKVIRREFRLVEGDAFNSSKLRRSRQRIQNLGFFEDVKVEKIPGSSPDKAVVKVNVEEMSTGQISLGAGYSSASGPLGDFSIQESNFLGRGQFVKVGLTIAAKKSEVEFSFTEPFFMEREVMAGFDVFHLREDHQSSSSHDSQRTGLGLRTSYHLTEDLTQGWKYLVQLDKVEDVADNASKLIKDQSGKNTLSQISHILRYDKRNQKFTPTDGYFVGLTTDLAGIGGKTRHLRNTLLATKYFPLDDKITLSVRGKVGYIVGLGKDVLLNERYYVGGESIRGFATSGIGPRDKITGDSLGGEWKYSGSTQLDFPLGLPEEFGINGRTFIDLGSAGSISPSASYVEDDAMMRIAAGAGVTWISPFGPVGLDLGFPLVEGDYDEVEHVRVNFGTRF